MSALNRPSDISGELLDQTRATYRRWFGPSYDTGALDVILAAAAASKLSGDPAWVLLVGGSGAAKTESIMPLVAAGGKAVSTISGEAALLSGTSKKDRSESATGGLLREMGNDGILIIKDVTSILSMNRDTRGLVLAALREIYDGYWSRNVGTDGGQTLVWRGRLVLIGGVTTAWDAAHAVISSMGDRFVLVRLGGDVETRRASGRQAMRNTGAEREMRDELCSIVEKLIGTVMPAMPIELTDDEIDELLDISDLVTRARTGVERDFQGNPAFAHALEMPTRFAKQLVAIVRGGMALGMSRKYAMIVALRAAGDSMPPLRLKMISDIAKHPMSKTADVVKRLQLPRQTVDRTLQEMHLLGLLVVDEEPYGAEGRVRWIYSLADEVSAETIANLTRNVTRGTGTDPSAPEMSLPPLET
jgi:hypothetical protein